jgi:5-methylcytosine-specific restriction protein A
LVLPDVREGCGGDGGVVPWSPKRPCTHPGCPELSATGRCANHPRPGSFRDPNRPSPRERGYPSNWPKLRLLVLAQQPVCGACELNPSSMVDHIRPLINGGTNDLGNLRGICFECHRAKTAQEAGRGRGVR